MEPTSKSNSINLGLYLGATLAILVILLYAIQLDLIIKWWFSLLVVAIVIGFGFVSAKKARQFSGGFINFKDAFVSYFITIAVGTAISSLVGILIFNVVDPEAAAQLNEQILLYSKQTMERFGAPQETIAAALEEASKKDNFAVGTQFQSYVFSLAFYAIIGLIVALIVKKTEPNNA